jgi:hypothetical protein
MAGNSNFGNIVSTTIDAYLPTLKDNYTNNSALLTYLKKAGNVKTENGGVRILENLEFSNSGAYVRYSGSATWALESNKFATAAEYNRKFVAVPLVFTGAEELANSGKQAVIDLIASRLKNGQNSLMNGLASDVYSDGTEADQIGGLKYLVADAPTTGTVGGIDRSDASNAFWRNYVKDNGGTAFTSSTILPAMNDVYINTKRNADTVDAIFAGNSLHNLYYSALTPQQQFTSSEGKGGFSRLTFNGDIKVELDGGIGGSCETDRMYFLNSNYLYLRPNASRNTGRKGRVDSINQDAYVEAFLWAGNMTMSGAQFQGVLADENL